MSISKKPTRSELKVRVYPDEMNELRVAAAEEGIPMTEWVRRAVRERMIRRRDDLELG